MTVKIEIEKEPESQPLARGYEAGTLFETRHEVWFKTSNGAVRLDCTPYCFVDNNALTVVYKFQNCKLSTAVITIENEH